VAMKLHSYVRRCLPLAVAVLCCLCRMVVRAEDAISGDSVIQKAVARGQSETRNAAPDFRYTKITVTEELDDDGKVQTRKEKVYDIAYRNGSPSAILLRVNGKAPSADDRKKQSENEMNFRQIVGPQSKTNRNDQRDTFLTPEVAARFRFKLVGCTNLNGRTAYEVLFEPKTPALPVRRMADRLLNRISGTLWIDTEEFEVARADIVLGSEVNLLGGIAGTLRKLAYTMVRTRIAEGVWIGTLTSGDFEGRKLLDSMRIKTKSESVNFRPVPMRVASRSAAVPGRSTVRLPERLD
jgi:hypothetical protein